jgi:recombination DNA repair RAD52 pathway protein
MPIKEIQNNFRVNNKKVKISLELIVKILIKNGVYIHDMEYVLDNKDQIKDEAVLNRLESMSNGD